jgi:hypothetical protein
MPKSLPDGALNLWEKVYDTAKQSGDSEEVAAQKSWGTLKNAGWEKGEDGKWRKKAQLTEFSLTVKKAIFDERSQEMRWRADTSDVDDDLYMDNMTHELFNDFVRRIESNETPPPEFCSEYWRGGQPYVSVSHYDDMNGEAVPGIVDATYVDGKFLKARGRFNDNPLGRACFKALCKDLSENKADTQDRVRVSIAFLDWKHQHKSSGYIFERKSLDDLCPECFLEMVKGESAGKRFLSGHLIHYALTRVPVNTRTVMEVERSMTTRKEDAASIIGEELSEELEAKATATVGKSQVLVEMSEAEKPEAVIEEAKSSKDKGDDGESEEDSEEEKKKMKDEKKSEVFDPTPIMETLGKLSADLAELKKSQAVNHPLDAGISQLKADYDAIAKSEFEPEEKLKMIQSAYSKLGQAIVETFQPKVVETKQEQVNASSDLVQALSQVMSPLAQKLDLISNQLSQQVQTNKVPATQPVVPQRRSIAPTLTMQQKAVTTSATPKLRELIERTT